MAGRMLRDTTDSEKVNLLTANAEVFFYRLMMKADDYGSFHANPKLLKANLYPLKLESVREADISRWMAECQKAGLIVIYTNAGKNFLRILNFGQRMRTKKKRFPDCPPELLTCENSQKSAADCGEMPPEVEDEVEIEDEVEGDNDGFFEMFRRVAGRHITDEELKKQVALFKNKYPNIHSNQAGALINAWVARIGKKEEKKPMVI